MGSWTARGYILASSKGPYVWWMKDYDNKLLECHIGRTGKMQK